MAFGSKSSGKKETKRASKDVARETELARREGPDQKDMIPSGKIAKGDMVPTVKVL